MNSKRHWDGVYQNKSDNEVSWFEHSPSLSLSLIKELNISISANIIDVGGGNSRLIDNLVEAGFENISLLDISAKALEKARERLGAKAEALEFIASDITKFKPQKSYELWHDRAAFHFLTEKKEIENYLGVLRKALAPGGFFIIGTFSEKGPDKCSGLPISKYSQSELKSVFEEDFEPVKCFNHAHATPFGTEQDFTFCVFKRK